MKKMMQKAFVFLAVTGLIVISGCEKEKKYDAPELPPASAFVIDFNDFQSQAKTTATYANWTTAVVTVGVWNTILTVTLAVPVATYLKAIEQAPVRIDNDSWKWSFNVTINQVVYTAELYADVTGNQVDWKMYVSQEGGFTDFLWYTGTCDILRTHGSWTLYHSPLINKEFLKIDWTHDWGNNTGDIKYTNILEGNDGYGSYVYYGLTLDAPFNAFYDLYGKKEDKLVKIEYNTTTSEGRIFYDDLWHCWSSTHEDIACP